MCRVKMFGLIEAIENLNLKLLPLDWVSEKKNSYFCKDIDLPEAYTWKMSADNVYDCISEAISSFKKCTEQKIKKSAYAESHSLKKRYSWKFLIKRKVPEDALKCFLSFLINIDVNNVSDAKGVIWAIDASRLYTLFLCVPGANEVSFFHPQIFKDTFDLLKLSKIFVTDDSNSKNSESETKEDTLLVTEKQEIFKRLCLYLCEMSEALDVLELSNNNIPIKKIAQSLISIISLEKKNNVFTCSPPINSIGYAVLKAYDVLTKLCSKKHGNVRNTTESILKELISVMYQSKSFNIHTNDNEIFRDHVFTFTLNLVQKNEKHATDFVIVFIQQMFIRISEDVDKITSDIAAFINKLSPKQFQYCIFWVVYLTFRENFEQKVAALEMISKLLTFDDRTLFSRMHEFLISAIISHFFDRSVAIRLKCLNIFASSIFSKQQQVMSIMRNLFGNKDQIGFPAFFDFNVFFNECYRNITHFDLPDSILPSGKDIVRRVLGNLMADEIVSVRCTALEALYSIFLLNKMWINNNRLKKLKLACKDTSTLIKEQVTKCITGLIVAYPLHARVVETWIEGIMTLMLDNDVKIQEKALKSIYIILFDNINHADEQSTAESTLPWRILRIIARKGRKSLLKYACNKLLKEGIIKELTLTNIVSHTNSTNSFMAWYLIESLSEFIDYSNPECIFYYFFEKNHLNMLGLLVAKTNIMHKLLKPCLALVLNYATNELSYFQKICASILRTMAHKA